MKITIEASFDDSANIIADVAYYVCKLKEIVNSYDEENIHKKLDELNS